jgi:hypothetical protein
VTLTTHSFRCINAACGAACLGGKAFLVLGETRARNPYLWFPGHPGAQELTDGRRECPNREAAIRPIDRGGDVEHRHGMPLELLEESDRG